VLWRAVGVGPPQGLTIGIGVQRTVWLRFGRLCSGSSEYARLALCTAMCRTPMSWWWWWRQ
jgi:hypothetical protein